MARKAKTQNEKIAAALADAKRAAGGGNVFRSSSLERRASLETLKLGGWLCEFLQGWYALVTPGARPGDTVPHFSNYWEFVRKYLGDRLGVDYALSPAQSIALHTDLASIPRQLLVHTARTTQNQVALPNGLSIFVSHDARLDAAVITEKDGIRILTLEHALAKLAPIEYRQPSPEVVAAIRTVRDIGALSRSLLGERSPQAAGRVVAALRDAGRSADATRIARDFVAAGLALGSPDDVDAITFARAAATQLPKGRPTIAVRIHALWDGMRAQILLQKGGVPAPKRASLDFPSIRQSIEKVYVHDAYNSLSIEGYQVTEELIGRVASGAWHPEREAADRAASDALAARGYREAFESVLVSLERIIGGAPLVDVIEEDFVTWRQNLFSPLVRAGVLPPEAIVGYRNKPVFIAGSRHVPPQSATLMDAVDAVFECIRKESDTWVRAVLGHFFFVYVHPFPDGNGRVGRFLMNVLLVASGYPWTVIRVSEKPRYFAALERASIEDDATALSMFVVGEMAASGTSARRDTKAKRRRDRR